MDRIILNGKNGLSKTIFLKGDCKGELSCSIGKNGKTLATGKVADGRINFDFALWSPSSPELYTVKVSDSSGRNILDIETGFRSLKVDGTSLLLNGSPIYVRGYIRGIKAHEHDNVSRLPEKEYHIKNIRNAKKLGFNLVRWHSTVPQESFIEESDRLGIFNQIEFAPQYTFEGGKKKFTLDLEHIAETVKRLGRHPSVFSFCLGNEIHNSGGNELVMKAIRIIREACPDVLVLDSCGWGEFDRNTNDYISQHIAYFFPCGSHGEMFNNTDCFDIDSSVKGSSVREELKGPSFSLKTKRLLQPSKPVLAHEAFHYISLPDTKSLRRKFRKAGSELPWWVDEIEKIRDAKGLKEDWDKLVRASEHFKKICLKEAAERLRMSSWLHGYQMLQLSDTNIYENPNGLLDCFDDLKKPFVSVMESCNKDLVIVPYLPAKCFEYGKPFDIKLYASNFSKDIDYADIKISLKKKDGKEVFSRVFKDFYLAKKGVYEIMTLDLMLKGSKPDSFEMKITVKAAGKNIFETSSSLWFFPAAKKNSVKKATVINAIDKKVVDGLAKGKTFLFLFDPSVPAAKTGLPLVNDHFKPVIWDRGHQLGGLVRKHPVCDKFPHDKMIDFQFYNLIEKGAKINLDTVPGLVPAVQIIDKAARDRMDGLIFNKKSFIPEYTLRRFGSLFEIAVGKGKLLVCTFNFSEANLAKPEVAFFYSALVDYVDSAAFKPSFKMSAADFEKWTASSRKNFVKEPVMNVYWEEDAEPVESVLWWEKVGVDITKLKH